VGREENSLPAYLENRISMKQYTYGLDLSLSSTGIAIFSNDAKLIKVVSVDTRSETLHQTKLKLIANSILELREKYKPERAIIEKGFYRFPASTEAVFKVHGLVSYLFSDIEQIFYAPTTVKKVVGGRGDMDKLELRAIVQKRFPKIEIWDNDQSDAVAIGLCFFIKREES
jgi:Holliday junction resolvasome RuvABC endonuclease subunit